MERATSFGDMLRQRLGHGTSTRLAQRLGVSQALISSWLAPYGKVPPIETVRHIATSLGEDELPWLRAAYPGLPWRGTGDGSAEVEQPEILAYYNGLPPENQELLRDMAAALYDAGNPKKERG